MALTIKHLNADASFLLTFEPLLSRPVPGYEPEPFHILLDPCITGPSTILHSKISLTTPKEPACIASLNEIPQPDLVIISQHKSDHCHESTLKQIPPTAKTIILAELSAAKVIRGWKHFDRHALLALERWEPPRASAMTARGTVTRISVPPVIHGGEPGEVTVAFIPQRRDLLGLHGAVGITYRPPPMVRQAQSPSSQRYFSHASRSGPLPLPIIPCGLTTPPATPRLHKSYSNLPTVFTEQGCPPPRPPAPHLNGLESLPAPTSPVLSLRSVRSATTLSRTGTAVTTAVSSTLSYASAQRTLSVLFSPHGSAFEGNLATYATSHLVNEAALPLTALLHSFDGVSSPWWLRGNFLPGVPAGKEIAVRLGAICWVSCHDRDKNKDKSKDKNVKGSGPGWLRTRRRWGRCAGKSVPAGEAEKHAHEKEEEEEEEEGCGAEAEGRLSRTTTITSTPAASRCCGKGAGQCGNGARRETQMIALGSGEEVVLTSEGVWNVDMRQQQQQQQQQHQQQVKVGKKDDAYVAIPPERKKRVTFHPFVGHSHHYWA